MLYNQYTSYPTFQVLLAFIVAAALTMVIMPAWIKLLKRTHVAEHRGHDDHRERRGHDEPEKDLEGRI